MWLYFTPGASEPKLPPNWKQPLCSALAASFCDTWTTWLWACLMSARGHWDYTGRKPRLELCFFFFFPNFLKISDSASLLRSCGCRSGLCSLVMGHQPLLEDMENAPAPEVAMTPFCTAGSDLCRSRPGGLSKHHPPWGVTGVWFYIRPWGPRLRPVGTWFLSTWYRNLPGGGAACLPKEWRSHQVTGAAAGWAGHWGCQGPETRSQFPEKKGLCI